MWIHLHAITPLQESFLASLGRAIALAQNFESNCRYAFGLNDLWEAFDTGKTNVDSWKRYANRLSKRQLGNVLAQHKSGELFNEQIYVLEAARVARNYLAHQAAESALYFPPLGGKHRLIDLLREPRPTLKIDEERSQMIQIRIQEALHCFENAVRDVAEGDSVVAEWIYVVQEKDQTMPAIAKNYVTDAVSWVLKPMIMHV